MAEGPTWRAGPDGIAHATNPGATRTRCNRMPVLERWAWPATSRCRMCEMMIREDERR